MKEPFQEGKLYVIPKKPDHHTAIWLPGMENLVGRVLVCVKVYYNDPRYGYLELPGLDEQINSWYDNRWVEEYIELAPQPDEICRCNIMDGCSCGRMEQDMLAQGKVRDPDHPNLWVKADQIEPLQLKIGDALNQDDDYFIPIDDNTDLSLTQALKKIPRYTGKPKIIHIDLSRYQQGEAAGMVKHLAQKIKSRFQ